MSVLPPTVDYRKCHVPYSIYAFALISALLGLCIFFVPLFAGAKVALAATPWTGSTFSYNGQTYPDNLVGVTVTINSSPGRPDSYMGNSGENIIWRSGTWYLIDGRIGSARTPERGEYWMSESSAVNNPWYVTANGTQTTNGVVGFFYDANHGWGGDYASSRTITFAVAFSLGDTTQYSTFPLLYNHSFIRYIVDNSDFRSRYTFQSTPAPVWQSASVSFDTINKTISWSIPSGNRQAIMQIFYSSMIDGTYSKVQAFSPVAMSGSWSVPSNGYYKVVFGSYPDGTVLQETPPSQIYDLPSQYWTDAYGAIDSTANTLTISSPSGNPLARVVIWYRDVLTSGWSITKTLLLPAGQSIIELLFNSGYYRVTYADPNNDQNIFQVQDFPYEVIENNGSKPAYVSYYYRPESNTLFAQFSLTNPEPQSVTLEASDDGEYWWEVVNDYVLELAPYVFLPEGYYAELVGVPLMKMLRLVIDGEDIVNIGMIDNSSSIVVPDIEDEPSWISSVVDWIQSFLGNFQPFFNALTAWMPAEFRQAFWMLVLISLLIGFITIIRK